MRSYPTYRNRQAPVGSIVLRIYLSGGEPRAYLREVKKADEDDVVFPSEEMEIETALRLAENRRETSPGTPVYIELTEGVQWDSKWGSLH